MFHNQTVIWCSLVIRWHLMGTNSVVVLVRLEFEFRGDSLMMFNQKLGLLDCRKIFVQKVLLFKAVTQLQTPSPP